ncbi:MAG: Rne/Rng family ribonuclease, partial [Hyphomicrobiales bacterium]
MGNKMLIDASHPEETRVVVARSNNRIEELDYESAERKQLRGNIYLAKVTRVEPSLQAAFVDYGGNRHGFLAFNEIHPDYYQIPYADRQALIEQEAADRAEDDDVDDVADARAERKDDNDNDNGGAAEADENAASPAEDDGADDDRGQSAADGGDAPESPEEEASDDADDERNGREEVESVGTVDALEEIPRRSRGKRRTYKIQEVIKRRQIILVQVVKEERGNKGAALTTYLSLAGRYCVLMPNTARGGGISRKISDAQDRKRLKDVVRGAEVPQGMGLIVRTAGANRTKAEIKRDFDYLLRLWENVRDLTLESSAPCLVYEEGSLIKRAIRDLYTKDIDSIVVEGDDAYKEAKDFMRMLMPSHARNIKAYKDKQPLFMRYGIESQLDELYSPYVTLSSGGYIVINQTEALVSIDVNSGKATREHNIEDTALRTNQEASDEVSRQMRLRDLAGLIVIDFIDMEERRNNRSVERRLKDRLKSDRARIQVGRISPFGLLEMSRQRMRSGVLESSTMPCPSCEGRGFVRSVQSASLQVMRGVEDYLQRNAAEDLLIHAPRDVALYILNQKRDHLLTIEASNGVSIFIESDDTLLSSEYSVERTSDRSSSASAGGQVIQVDSPFDGGTEGDGEEDGSGRRKKRRRKRGRRGSRQSRRTDEQTGEFEDTDADGDAEDTEEPVAADAGDDERPEERRSRRGGRGRRRRRSEPETVEASEATGATGAKSDDDAAEDKPKPRPRRRRRAAAETVTDEAVSDDTVAEVAAADEDAAPAEDAKQDKPRRRPRSRSRAKAATNGADNGDTESVAEAKDASADDGERTGGNGAEPQAAPA